MGAIRPYVRPVRAPFGVHRYRLICHSIPGEPMADLNNLMKTPLFDLHVELGAKMVPFAGYAMPVHYPLGIMGEHKHCRAAAGLFDVSHMGQAYVHGKGGDPATALEKLMPRALASLQPGKMRYALLLNDAGGIIDDLMVTRTHDSEGTVYIVVNAASKDDDYDRLEDVLGDEISLEPLEDRALLALQGPAAVDVLAKHAPEVADLSFMEATSVTLEGVVCWVSRSGYTGEDGFEISIPAARAEKFARRLLGDDRVEFIGLGARDSLRLEVGLCLSGHDFDGDITPAMADLGFAVTAGRRAALDFPGAEQIVQQFTDGPAKKRVGILLDGRAPAREGAIIRDMDGNEIGVLTSGGFGPTLGAPVAMGYVPLSFSQPDTHIQIEVRGRLLPAKVAAMPFVPQNYVRKSKA